MKKIILVFAVFIVSSCAELQQVVNQIPMGTGIGNVSNMEINGGLKEALQFGVQDGISKLGQKNGFFSNNLVKITLPQELQAVDKTLRTFGLGSLADEGLKVLNRAAEDAVTEAAPIFSNAITNITFADATNILLGNNTSATTYLQNSTTSQLQLAFQPKIQNSFTKVGADKVWTNIITKYNALTKKNINTDLSSYVTEKAIEGVFKMVAQKEIGIRQNISERTTDLLKKVFALQDNKTATINKQ